MRRTLTPEKRAIIDRGFLDTTFTALTPTETAPRTRALFAAFSIAQGTLNPFADQPLPVGWTATGGDRRPPEVGRSR